MSAKVTTVDIIEYLLEIDRKKDELPENDDGFRTSKEIAKALGLSVKITRRILHEIDEMGSLLIERRPRKVFGGTSAIVAYKLKDGTEIDDYFKE